MINEKDRSQLLRMAGNIAGGIVNGVSSGVVGSMNQDRNVKISQDEIAKYSVQLAYLTLLEVDKLIEEKKNEQPT